MLVYPGGKGTRAQVGDEKVRAWVRSIHERAHLTTSVCTGAFILADVRLHSEDRAREIKRGLHYDPMPLV